MVLLHGRGRVKMSTKDICYRDTTPFTKDEFYAEYFTPFRIEMTSDIWDEWARDWLNDMGWKKECFSYDNDRDSGTLWVQTDDGWEDTGISKKDGDYLLCEMWDDAEESAFMVFAEKP